MTFTEQYNPHQQEVEGKRFKHALSIQKFRNQPIPSDFTITVKEDAVLQEGQVIGYSRLGKTLKWVGGSVVSQG